MKLHSGTTLYFLGIGYFAGFIGLLAFFFGLNGFGSCTTTYLSAMTSSGTPASYGNDVSRCGAQIGIGEVGVGFFLFFLLIVLLAEVWGADPELDRRGFIPGSNRESPKRMALLFGLQALTVVLAFVIITALLYYVQVSYGP